MAIGWDFEEKSALQYRLKAAQNKILRFESGEEYRRIEENHKKTYAAMARENRKLHRELAAAHAAIVTNRNNWMQALDDCEAEYRKKLAEKDREISRLQSRIEELICQRDRAKDKLHDKNEELYAVKTELEEERDKNAMLTAQKNRNFENSSKSSSETPNHKKITNNRERTGRSPGGQKGHIAHQAKIQTPTRTVEIPPPDKYLTDQYKATGKLIRKQVVNVHLALDVVEYVTPEFRDVETRQKVHADFPDGVINRVNYGGSIKALFYQLNNQCNVSIDNAIAIVSDLTNGELQISKGFVNNLLKKFETLTKNEREELFRELQESPVMHTDFTFGRMNGKTVAVSICSAGGAAMYLARDKKGYAGVEGTPVEGYTGILIHDHESTFLHYGTGHQECLVHVLRYLKGAEENEPERVWAGQMRGLLQEMIHHVKETGNEIDEQRVSYLEARYDEIIALAETEFDYEPPGKYSREGFNLFRRLKEDRPHYLLFLRDRRVDPDNNEAERHGRVYKRKSRQVMAFRSPETRSAYCNGLTVIGIIKQSGKELHAEMAKIFNGNNYALSYT